MAHANGKIYRDASTNPPYGIDARGDVAVVVQRSSGDWGQLCGDVDKNGADVNKVNIHSVHKPVRSDLQGGTEQEIKVPAKYGFAIDAKSTGSGTTLSFVQQLRSQGASYAHWRWNKPRARAAVRRSITVSRTSTATATASSRTGRRPSSPASRPARSPSTEASRFPWRSPGAARRPRP